MWYNSRQVYTVNTRIAPGGFTVELACASPSKALLDYVVLGSGGRQATGSIAVDGPGHRFVAVDFSVLTVGVTDLRIQERPCTTEAREKQPDHGSPIPAALLGVIFSSIVGSHGIAAASEPDRSLQWRDAGVQTHLASDLSPSQERFVASG